MNTAAIVLLLFVSLLGESFAGYSTGRRTHKPKSPGTAVVHPGKIDDVDSGSAGFKEECKCAKEGVQSHPSDGFTSEDSSIDKGIKPQPFVDEDEYGDGKISDVPETIEGDRIPLGIPDEQPDQPGSHPDQPGNKDFPTDPDQPGNEDFPTDPDQPGNEDFSIDLDQPGNKDFPTDPDQPGNKDFPTDPDQPGNKDFPTDLEPKVETEPGKETTFEFGIPPDPIVPVKPPVRIHPIPETGVLEPYPIKVGGGNEDINLYDLMNRLELSRFLHLVEEANLKDLLTGEEPMTIFAPSDYALSKLNADTIRKLATNQELLRQFVLYHCVDGKISGASFDERDNSVMTTKFDTDIHVNRYGEGWFVNGIPITNKDQTCRNGVIHVMDNSLYPLPTGDLLETLEKLGNFEIFIELIRNAKLEDELKGETVYTIFAPTDVAFSKLPPANLEWLKWDIPAIKRLFRQLTVNGMYYTTWIPSGNGQLTSIGDTTLALSGYPNDISVNDVRLSQYDITANNGCIHVIDDIWFLSDLGTPSSPSENKRHH